jgi:hypothetical protein
MLNAIDSKRNWTMDNTLVHIENGGGNPFGLRALGANVATRKGVTYLNNVAI